GAARSVQHDGAPRERSPRDASRGGYTRPGPEWCAATGPHVIRSNAPNGCPAFMRARQPYRSTPLPLSAPRVRDHAIGARATSPPLVRALRTTRRTHVDVPNAPPGRRSARAVERQPLRASDEGDVQGWSEVGGGGARPRPVARSRVR